MGVIHKLKPEISEFIIFQKNNNSALSCRKLTTLILENFQTKVSKSSINKVIKEAGLSAPVGRTPKKKKVRIPMPSLPILLEGSPKKELQLKPEKSEQDALLLKREEERLAGEAKEKIRLEEERKARLAEEERLASEAKEKARLEEEKKLKLAEEARFAEEAARKAAQEAARKAEEERLAKEKARREEEAKRIEELKAAEEEARKALEESARKDEEERVAKEKARLEEARRQQEEEKLKDALRIAEEEKAKALEIARKAEAERLSQEAKSAALLSIGRLAQIENTGLILLKGVDSIFGGTQLIAKAIKDRLGRAENNLTQIVENLIFMPLLNEKIDLAVRDNLLNYLNSLEEARFINTDIMRVVDFVAQEVRCVKIILSEGGSLYIDGQFCSAWSSEHMPYGFASPIKAVKNYIDKYFSQGHPMVLFSAPGYDVPSAEFFKLLSAFEAKTSSISNLVLYGNKFEELEVLPVSLSKRQFLIFGLWPWQFTSCRRVKNIGEFRPMHIEAQNKDVFIADIELDLQHPGLGKQFSLAGCAVKTSLSEKTKMVILSNAPPGAIDLGELAATYLNHWPNLEEAFQDYSRKIELFTYTANLKLPTPADNKGPLLGNSPKVKDILGSYLAALDAYTRCYLFQAGLETKGIEFMNESFYSQPVRLVKTSESYLAKFALPSESQFGSKLAYACRRFNEKEAWLSSGMRLYLSIE